MSRPISECMSVHDVYVSDIQKFIPQLTKDLHKGSCGRIGVVGGCQEYTGAPYFAAISALKLGADIAYVICCKEAAPVIKSYSPELIVYPYLDDDQLLAKVSPCLERLHSLVVGPGLGRDPDVLKKTEAIIRYCNSELEVPLPLIIDADGLFLITQRMDIVKHYRGPVIITPNAREYSILCQKLSVNENEYAKIAESLDVVILRKGDQDIIYNGIHRDCLRLPDEDLLISCDVPGSYRRCGGQGDILSGCTAVFVVWFLLMKYKNVDFNKIYRLRDIPHRDSMVAAEQKNVFYDRLYGFSLACYAASSLTRHCSNIAFTKYGRGMTASDMISIIPIAFQNLFGR